MSFLSLLVYIPLQILFIPITILAAMLVAYKQIAVSKRLGISQTAIEIINGRWTMHIFGMREDKASARLAAALPNTSLFGLWLALFPLWVKYKISGKYFMYPTESEPGSENLGNFIIARTLYFDRIIARVISGVEQFVVMGAGYDTRAYGEFKREGLACFEVDQPGVQKHKKAALVESGISHNQVTFVAVEFDKESMFEKLKEAGYDPEKKTLFLWEGVTLYLSEGDVRKTMQDVKNNAGVGSVLLADLYGERMIRIGKSKANKKTLDYTNEALDFHLDFSIDYEGELSRFVRSEAMEVGETFFLGSKDKKGPYLVVAEMVWCQE